MPEESINIYMSLVDKVSGPLSGIFRGVRAYSTGYVPNPQRDRWKREDRRIGRISQDADEKTGWPKANGIFRGVLSSCPSCSRRSVTTTNQEGWRGLRATPSSHPSELAF